MTIQTIITPTGDRLVVVPEADFNRLREDAEMVSDVAAYIEAKRKLAAGEDELIPSAIVDRLLDGENPVRVWREHRGLSTEALSLAAGIALDELWTIESDFGKASVESLRKIAPAMKLTIDDLV